jgi:hypothetical protein
MIAPEDSGWRFENRRTHLRAPKLAVETIPTDAQLF